MALEDINEYDDQIESIADDVQDEIRDDFDMDALREQSIRTSASYEGIDGFETANQGGFAGLTSLQRLILAILFLIDVAIVIYVVLSIMGII